MFSLSFLASALLVVSGASAQTTADCSSLRKAISSYSTETASDGLDTSITTFNALLDVLGFDESVIAQFGSANVLVPTDRAFINFVSQVGGPDVEPMAFVMSHPNTFKQIVLYHFTAPLTGSSGEATTALAAMTRLSSFIDTSVICGRDDSTNVKIHYTPGDTAATVKLQEPIGKHYTANTEASICSTDAVTVTTVDTVLTPCPHSMTFPDGPPGERGCMTVAMAAAELSESHPLGTMPYEDTSSTIISSLKHPNILKNSGQDLTVFLPTIEALDAAGVTNEDFLAIPDALDHVVKGHIARREVCVGGNIPAVPVETNAADGTFCSTEGTLTMVANGASGIVVTADGTAAEATTTPITNIAVCGGLVHVVDGVLMPCDIAEYSSTTSESGTTDTTTADGTTTARGVDTAPVTGTESSGAGAMAVATGVAGAAVAAAALFL